MKPWPCLALPVVALLLSIASPSPAVTIHVPGGEPTIMDGIQAATPGDTVLVACGTYYEHGLVVDSEICIRSETGDPGCVTIDAQQLGGVFRCQDVGDGARIEGFTITGGLVRPGEPWARGAGMFCDHASPQVTDCVFVANEAEHGGSGMCLRLSSPTVLRCDFIRNVEAVDGGGLYINGACSPTISHCTFIENEALFWGGAIFAQLASPLITHCTLVGNSAHWGGGFWCVGCQHTAIVNSIIAYSEEGEGVYVYDNPSIPSDVEVVCSDVFGNSGGNYGGAIEDPTGTGGNISEHPLFCNLEGDDLRLASISPCLPENNSCAVQMGARGMGCDYPTGVTVESPARRFRTWNAPNPFNPATEIHFDLPGSTPVTLRIYDSSGHLIRELLAGARQAAGPQRVHWDGRDRRGGELGSGVYFYRIETGAASATRKMTLIR